jgi:hypothetical protein
MAANSTTNRQSDISVEARRRGRWWIQFVLTAFLVMSLTEFVAVALYLRRIVFPDTYQLFNVIWVRNLPLLLWGCVLWGALRRRQGVWPAFGALIGASLVLLAITIHVSVGFLYMSTVHRGPPPSFDSTQGLGFAFVIGLVGSIAAGLVGALVGGLAGWVRRASKPRAGSRPTP